MRRLATLGAALAVAVAGLVTAPNDLAVAATDPASPGQYSTTFDRAVVVDRPVTFKVIVKFHTHATPDGVRAKMATSYTIKLEDAAGVLHTPDSAPQSAPVRLVNNEYLIQWTLSFNLTPSTVARGAGAVVVSSGGGFSEKWTEDGVERTAFFTPVAGSRTPVQLLRTAPAPVVHKPSAPQRAHASVSSKRARLYWSAPRSTGGSRIDHYQVYRSRFTRTLSASARSYLFTGLHNRTRYTLYVRAHNRAGWGSWTHAYARPTRH
jgi:Fibronectin type III domain